MQKAVLVALFSATLILSHAQGSWLYPQKLFPFEAENKKWGYTDENYKLVVFPKYEQATAPSEGLAAVKVNGKWGYVNEAGKEVVAPQYEEAGEFHEEKAAVKKNGKYGFINTEGRDVISFSYDYAYAFSEGLAAVSYNGKYGFIDRNGKKVIAFEYDEVNSFSEGLARVLKGTTIYDKQGFIDKTGKLVIPFQYDHDFYTYGSNWNVPRNFQDGLHYVSKNFQAGYINNKGKEVIPTKYSRLTPFHKGWAAYHNATERKWGILNKTGKEFTPAIFDDVEFELVDVGYNLIITKNRTSSTYGLFSTASEQILTLPYYTIIREMSDGMMAMQVNGKSGYLDSTGRRVIDAKYDFADKFINGTAIVSLNEKYGIINKQGKEIVPLKYNDVENFSEGMAVVVLNGKAGYADINGREVIPPQYVDAYDFVEGIGTVKGTKYGFIDKTGKAITEQKFDKVTYFLNGVSIVTIGNKSGVINKAGKEIVPLTYSQITNAGNYLFFEKDTKWGVMNTSGSIIVPAQFDGFIQQYIGETAIAVKAGKAVYVDKTGKVTGEVNQ